MNVIAGFVRVRETGVGVGDLVVTALDVRGHADVGEGRSLAERASGRIGSALTDEQGEFLIEYEDEPRPDGTEGDSQARPDVLVTVTAPDIAGDGSRDGALYVMPKPHRNAGRMESLAIHLPLKLLEDAGVPLPGEPEEPARVLITLHRAESRARELEKGIRRLEGERVDEERAIEMDFDSSFKPALLRSVSSVPDSLVVPEHFVADPSDIEQANRHAIEARVDQRFTAGGSLPLRMRTRFHLHPEQADRLMDLADNGAQSLTPAELKQVLLNSDEPEPPTPAELFDSEPLLREFLSRTHQEKCSDEHLGLAPAHEEEPAGDGGQGQGDTDGVSHDDVVTRVVERLLGPVTAPEHGLGHDGANGGRPDRDAIQHSVDTFVMRPGPADRPALFDFHRLLIAFDHVWRELIDDNVVATARALHRRVVELGGQLTDALAQGRDAVEALREEVVLVEEAARRVAVPGLMAMRSLPVTGVTGLSTSAGDGRLLATDGVPDGDSTSPPAGGGVRPGHSMVDAYETGANEMVVLGDQAPIDLLHRLLALLQTSYSFTIYGASPKSRAVNFGVVTTFRATLEPTAYQVGELVKTIPLTPGEERKWSSKTSRQFKRYEKENARWSSVRRDELQTTSRAEAEILRKAMATTNFSLTAQGSYNIGISSGDKTMQLGRDAQKDSQDTKRDFREAVIKASQEYNQERMVEISFEESEEFEASESGLIKNPNDELAATCCFYELQRRFRVSERLHRVAPAVLVAQEVPNPAQITDAFLLAHDWILRRVMLDERYIDALDYLRHDVSGDRLALQELLATVRQQRQVVTSLRQEFTVSQRQAEERYEALFDAVESRAGSIQRQNRGGIFRRVAERLGIKDAESPEAARVREEAARDAEQRAAERVRDLAMRLQRELTTLNEATEKYAQTRSEHRNREVQIAQLQLHVKLNILYYMQAIWAFEPPHQRFLRLHQVKVPVFRDKGTSYTLTGPTGDSRLVGLENGQLVEAEAHEFVVIPDIELTGEHQTLVEVADLDRLLGFHGNYMIFPLKESNALTDFLMAPYVDAGWRVMDPDEPTSLNLSEFARYVCFLHERLDAQIFEQLKPELRQRYRQLLLAPSRDGEEIIVPAANGSLYIEILPGSHPLLENFKIAHRAVDVRKVTSETRRVELENTRFAARLLADPQHLEDPHIEKKVVFEREPKVVAVAEEDQ